MPKTIPGHLMLRRSGFLGAVLGCWLQVGALIAPTDARAQSTPDDPVSHAYALATLDNVWTLVHNEFYDPRTLGIDWEAVGAKYRNQTGAATSQAKLAVLINQMLHELPASHLGYYTPSDTAYYDLADILSYYPNGVEGRLIDHFPHGEIWYPGIGIFTRNIAGQTFISGVLDGLAAARAGLHVGDEIVAVDGQPFTPVGSFQGKVGKETRIAIRRTRQGPIEQVAVIPQRIYPARAYLTALAESVHVIPAEGFSVGYIRLWTFYRRDYREFLRNELFGPRLKGADALILDLRDGWGGGSPDILQLFDSRVPLLETTSREGVASIDNPKWRSPMVLLANEGTRSMKEIVALGFQKYGYGAIVGTRTAGAALVAHGILLSDGLLVLPVSDVRVDGERLEGRGVTPTIDVPFDIRYADGRDPQLERALEAAVEEVRRRRTP